MKDEWFEDPLGGYEENARHLFGYPESTLGEYLRVKGARNTPSTPCFIERFWGRCERDYHISLDGGLVSQMPLNRLLWEVQLALLQMFDWFHPSLILLPRDGFMVPLLINQATRPDSAQLGRPSHKVQARSRNQDSDA